MSQFASTLYPQTNPSNPILLAFRDYCGDRIPPLERVSRLFLSNWKHLRAVRESSKPQKDHARRVLNRLVSLSG